MHCVLPGVFIVVGEHTTPLNPGAGGSEMVPGRLEAEIESAARLAATTPMICTGIVSRDGLDEMCKVTVATIPSEIGVVFTPYTKHVLPLQAIVLPAFVAAIPTANVAPVISEG